MPSNHQGTSGRPLKTSQNRKLPRAAVCTVTVRMFVPQYSQDKKKRIIVQNVNQRPYVYFKWTLKSSFCSHTKDRKSDVLTIQFIVFFILYFYILVTEHSRFLIHTQLFTSYWIHLTIALLHSRAYASSLQFDLTTHSFVFQLQQGSV